MMKNKPVSLSPLLFATVLMLFLPACSSSPAESDPPQTDELIVDRDGNHMDQTPEDHSEITGYGGTLQFPDGTDLSEPAELPPMYTDFAARFSEDDILVNTDPQGKILLSEDFAGSRYVCFSMEALETATSMPYPDIEDHIVYVDASEGYIENLQPDTIYIPVSDSGISDGQFLPAPRMSDDGTFTGSKFTRTEVLKDSSGSMFHFYVKNNGKTEVEISMNGMHKTTLTAGKDGFISETLGFFNQTYECVAKAAVDGAEIDIDWAVAVSDETEALKFGESVDLITIMPQDMTVASGTIKDDSGLDLDKKLNRDNGTYVSFYVENLGNDPVQITINGQNSRTLEAGERGHIDMEVTQGLFGGDKTYTFKAVAGTNGGTVHINYTICQRDARS